MVERLSKIETSTSTDRPVRFGHAFSGHARSKCDSDSLRSKPVVASRCDDGFVRFYTTCCLGVAHRSYSIPIRSHGCWGRLALSFGTGFRAPRFDAGFWHAIAGSNETKMLPRSKYTNSTSDAKGESVSKVSVFECCGTMPPKAVRCEFANRSRRSVQSCRPFQRNRPSRHC